MNAHTAGCIAAVRFAREWRQNLHLWTDEKLVGLAKTKAMGTYIQPPAQQRYLQGFIEAVQEYRRGQRH